MIRPNDVFNALQYATDEDLDKDGKTVFITGLIDLKRVADFLNGEDDEEEPEPEDYESEEDED
jgi:hypothetical protein